MCLTVYIVGMGVHMDQFYTIQETAKLLKVSRATIYNWMGDGELKYVEIGGVRRIPREAIRELVRRAGIELEKSEENLMPSLALA